MPTSDQPTASDREADLQRICEEVGREMFGCPASEYDPYSDFAKAVARRYAATVGAGAPNEPLLAPIFKANDAGMGSDFLEAYLSADQIFVEIEQPDAGDSEIGFGQACYIGLSLDDAEAFARWMLATVKRGRATAEPSPSDQE